VRDYPEFEVGVQCLPQLEEFELAGELRREGVPSLHCWRYLLVGAVDDDRANAIAGRLRQTAPLGNIVIPRGTLQAIFAEQPANPIAILGGWPARRAQSAVRRLQEVSGAVVIL
jgi:hypothetical protein